MELSPAARILVPLAIAALACLLAFFVEAPIWAALIGLVAGAGAIMIALPGLLAPPASVEVVPVVRNEEDSAREMIDALTDPMLLLSEGRIVAANSAARRLLGDWIEKQDVRPALRHPEVVERLMSRSSSEQGPEKIEVEGIGDPDRRWMVTIASLG